MKKLRNNFFSQYGVMSMNTNPYGSNPNILENKILILEKRIQELENKIYNLEINDTTLSNPNYNNNSMYMI